jgi:hypothetical protein
MQFDPDNAVVKLCAEGMNAEFEGDTEKAHHIFQQAWDSATNDFEAFTAAHYLARNQKDPADTLQWNIKALTHANAVNDDDMIVHYPSLYLNVAKSYEVLNELNEAAKYYKLAADKANHLPNGKYGDMIRAGIAEGLKRTKFIEPINSKLAALIDRWCERKDLKPLSFILPAWVGNLNTPGDMDKLTSALSYLSATRSLNSQEQEIVDELIRENRDLRDYNGL